MPAPSLDRDRAWLLERLADLAAVSCEPMFGGLGLSVGESFCGIVFQGKLYLRTDAAT